MKRLYRLGVIAIVTSALPIAGCSDGPGESGTMTTGGTSAAGASTGGAGTQLLGFSAYTLLNAADAPAGEAAPATYVSATCSTCHGEQGEGIEFLGPEIRHTPIDYATPIIRGGRLDPTGKQTGMVDFPAAPSGNKTVVSDSDLAAILGWLNGLPRPTTGKGLYRDFCGNCHGPNTPTGGAVPVAIGGKAASLVAAKVRAGVGADITMRGSFMPQFDPTLLTDSELTLIQSFIGSN